MDVKFINPFLQGTVEVLKKMAFMEPTPGRVYLKETNIAAGDVSGIIGITGDATGSLAISFSEVCICNIVSRMLGEVHTKASQEVFDAVGEITNMISGVARTHMEKEGMMVFAAIPSVIFGKNHTIDHILDSPSIIIPFSTEKGTFVVDVCIKKTAPEVMKAEDYQVTNRKTPVSAAPKEGNDKKPEKESVPSGTDRITILKKQLKEIVTARDEIVKQLTEQPFMEISRRTAFKKQLPYLDAKIKRLKLDVNALIMMSKISQDDIDNPKIIAHYQHYDSKKRNN